MPKKKTDAHEPAESAAEPSRWLLVAMERVPIEEAWKDSAEVVLTRLRGQAETLIQLIEEYRLEGAVHIAAKGDLARSAFNHVGAAKSHLESQLFHLPRSPMVDSFPKVMLPFDDDPLLKKTEIVWSAVELLEEATRGFFGGQSWAKARYNGLTTVSPTVCTQLREGVRLINNILERADVRTKIENENEVPQYVSLDQIAIMCGYKGKRTPERWIQNGEMPPPAIEGGGGKAASWIWTEIRPWLAEKTKRILPERYPSLIETE